MTTRQITAIGIGVAILAVGAVVGVAISTAPVRGAVRAYTQIVELARVGDLEHVRALCTQRFLSAHRLEEASEGGVKGIPRNIHKNFKAWREDKAVWLCPTNRMGPVYQFTQEQGVWKFDGPIGLMDAQGRVERMTEGSEVE